MQHGSPRGEPAEPDAGGVDVPCQPVSAMPSGANRHGRRNQERLVEGHSSSVETDQSSGVVDISQFGFRVPDGAPFSAGHGPVAAGCFPSFWTLRGAGSPAYPARLNPGGVATGTYGNGSPGRRLDMARRRLLAGDTPVDVAVATGFHDQSHLTRHFKRLLAVTPGRYQRCVTRSRINDVQDDPHSSPVDCSGDLRPIGSAVREQDRSRRS